MAAADQMLGPEAIASADPGFTMRPLSWQTGTEIGGLDLTRSDAIPEPVISALWRLVCERGILLFRDQFLPHDQHLDFTRRFGPQIGRASGWERVCQSGSLSVVAGALKHKQTHN